MPYIRLPNGTWKKVNDGAPVDTTLKISGAAADAKAVGDALAGTVRHDSAQELTDIQKKQARFNIGAASINDIAEANTEIESLKEENDKFDFFIMRESVTGFDPVIYKYDYDGVYGHKYDYCADAWRPFPETVELNTPVLLYDFTVVNSLNYWKYSTFESKISEEYGSYIKFKVFLKVELFGSIRTLGLEISKDMLVEIGTDNFKFDNGAYVIYSIVDLSSLPEEYADMFTSIGLYYVKTAETEYLARFVWECCLDYVHEFSIPDTIARTADVEASLATKENKYDWKTIVYNKYFSQFVANIPNNKEEYKIDWDAASAVPAVSGETTTSAISNVLVGISTILTEPAKTDRIINAFTTYIIPNYNELIAKGVCIAGQKISFIFNDVHNPDLEPFLEEYIIFTPANPNASEEKWILWVYGGHVRGRGYINYNATTGEISGNVMKPMNGEVDTTLSLPNYAADAESVGKAINNISEAIANLPKSNDEEIEMLIEADLLPAVTTVSGAILTDNSGNVILKY